MTRHELLQMRATPAPRSLGDFLDTDNVWTENTGVGAVGHRPADLHSALYEAYIPERQVAVCGASIRLSPIAAGQLMLLCGRLCPHCWLAQPPETPASPGR